MAKKFDPNLDLLLFLCGLRELCNPVEVMLWTYRVSQSKADHIDTLRYLLYHRHKHSIGVQ